MTDSVLTQRYPRCQVLLSAGLPRENRLPKAALGPQITGAMDISGMVTRVRTTKTLAQPNGTFEIGLTFQSLGEAIRALSTERRSMNMLAVPENLVDIAFDPGVRGSEMETVMQGPLTRIYEKQAVGPDGAPQREVVLAGEDWGKILVQHEIPAHQFTAFLQGDQELTARTGAGAMLWGSVGQVCERLFNAVLVDRISALQLKMQQVFTIDIDTGLYSVSDWGWTQQDNLWHRQGKFWTALKGLADEPWTELFADYLPRWAAQGPKDGLERVPSDPTAPARFVLRLRKRPFDEDRWKVLETHVVRDEELVYAESTLADDERVNWVMIDFAALSSIAEVQKDFVLYQTRRFDLEDAEAHGARLLLRQSAYLNQPHGQHGSLLQDAAEHDQLAEGAGILHGFADWRAKMLWDFYAINHRLHRATWVIPGRPEIRIGHRVENQRDPSSWFVKEEAERRTSYVERVVHDYTEASRRFWTHLGLTRGQPIDGFVRPFTDGQHEARTTPAGAQ